MNRKQKCLSGLDSERRCSFHVSQTSFLRGFRVSGLVTRDREQTGGGRIHLQVQKPNEVPAGMFSNRTGFTGETNSQRVAWQRSWNSANLRQNGQHILETSDKCVVCFTEDETDLHVELNVMLCSAVLRGCIKSKCHAACSMTCTHLDTDLLAHALFATKEVCELIVFCCVVCEWTRTRTVTL